MNFIKKRNLPELLAPAGSFEHLKAAVAAGADAIYMGGEKFGARAYAHNFSREDMIEALQFAHFHERKLYLTVNTLMKEKELFEELGDFLFLFFLFLPKIILLPEQLWSMSFKQYVWRKKWKSRPLCPALPTSIYSDEC